ncbi:MAG TPA: hypothetical protein VN659_14180 [Pyrinomonadaceae bacterium]|nr:hypothetical protein [Pyrinomonadaceae bacterium]
MKITALTVIGIHFVVVVLHSIAHNVLPVEATPAQLAFILPVIIVAPLVAGVILIKFEKAGMILLAATMLGSLIFGIYYHFIADTIDHVAHVAHREPLFWSQMFVVTSYLLAITEAAGAAVGLISLLRQKQSIKSYAA